MARKKNALKPKEPIRLRAKTLSNGNKSLYLDTYINGRRSYEFLKMYIIPETDAASRVRNENTLRAANAIKAQKILELTNGEAGISNTATRSNTLLIDWMREYSDRKLRTGISGKYSKQINKTVTHLIRYSGEAVTMAEIDKTYCLGFIAYLRNAKRKDGKPIANVTMANYLRCLNCALNLAVREDIISINPITRINADDKISIPESRREYLIIEEIKELITASCTSEAVKQAYLFSCFTGLRLGDIRALTWGDVIMDGSQCRLKIVMHKTQKTLYLPLSDEAMKWMPLRGEAENTDKVFHIPSDTYINKVLKVWAQNSGISKVVTFHTARHSFATLMLTLGADLYTTSKLLGHSQIRTTTIYAKIVDKKKDEAVNLVNEAFNNLRE